MVEGRFSIRQDGEELLQIEEERIFANSREHFDAVRSGKGVVDGSGYCIRRKHRRYNSDSLRFTKRDVRYLIGACAGECCLKHKILHCIAGIIYFELIQNVWIEGCGSCLRSSDQRMYAQREHHIVGVGRAWKQM